MIQYIKRKDLNLEKYNTCIENSVQSRIYAFSWYLDIVADNWDVLILNDYEVVMPLPWKQKYFIKYVSQPYFCQQLGVFSKEITSKEMQEQMMKYIPKKFVKISLNFNSHNLVTSKMKSKKNYTLKLNNSYDTLFKSFSKRRKRSIKAGEKNCLCVRNTSIFKLTEMKQEFYSHINFSKIMIEELSNYVLNNDKGFILGVFKDEALLGGSLFLKSSNRIIYLFSSYNNEAKKLQASSFLISRVIKEYQNSNYTLDFEGSNIPSIGSFFKSFLAKNISYYHISYINFPKFISFFKKA